MFGKDQKSIRKASSINKLSKYVKKLSLNKLSIVNIERNNEDQASSTTTHLDPFSYDTNSNLSTLTRNLTETFNNSPVKIKPTEKSMKTGDSKSYWTSCSDNVYIDKKCAEKAYRVLSYKKDPITGKRVIFDILDGKPYFLGSGKNKRLTHNAVCFESKLAALSERFPSNQHLAAKSGNGFHPRILVVFDVWGFCKRRRGGVASRICEYVKFMKIEKYLDSPHPIISRLPKKYVEPYYFPNPDKQKLTRLNNDDFVKRYGMLNHH